MAEVTPDDLAPASGANVTVERVAGDDPHSAVFKVVGQLDVSTDAVLSGALNDAMRAHPRRIVLDVSELGFMDSSGLAVLLSAAQRVESLELHNPTDIVRRLVAIAGLNEIVRLTPDA
jgi:anti-anti-sigma factor